MVIKAPSSAGPAEAASAAPCGEREDSEFDRVELGLEKRENKGEGRCALCAMYPAKTLNSVCLEDGRTVEGELLCADSQFNLLLQNVKEHIPIPWPPIEEAFSQLERQQEGEKKEEEGDPAAAASRPAEARPQQGHQVSVQLIERVRPHALILNSNIKSVKVASPLFSRAVAEAQRSSPSAAVFV
ncbi:hypothetical protein Efla_003124 [Eimeria flavescens]